MSAMGQGEGMQAVQRSQQLRPWRHTHEQTAVTGLTHQKRRGRRRRSAGIRRRDEIWMERREEGGKKV